MTEPTQAGGATPPAAGATPAQTPPAPPPAPASPAPATPPATGDDALGDAGKRALDQERSARKAAEAAAKTAQEELEKLRTASQSDAEKALAAAKKEGATEAQAKADARIRRAEVRGALQAAGISPTELDLAAMATEFAELTVTDAGDVDGLATAVETFRKGHPGLFGKPAPTGSADGGARGDGKAVTRDQLKKMTPVEINAAFARGELAGLLKPGG